jgi:hypothetical protein
MGQKVEPVVYKSFEEADAAGKPEGSRARTTIYRVSDPERPGQDVYVWSDDPKRAAGRAAVFWGVEVHPLSESARATLRAELSRHKGRKK